MFGRPSPQQTDEFEAVALTQLDALVRSATRLCESREEAEDAVQETYLQAWKYCVVLCGSRSNGSHGT